MKVLHVIGAVALSVWSVDVEAQSLEQRVLDAPSDTVRMSFDARDGVCGNGRYYNFGGRFGDDSGSYRFGNCEPGPVRVQFEKSSGRIVSIRVRVGGAWQPATAVMDLGPVAAQEARDWLLDLVPATTASVAEDAIVGAVLADAPDPWQRLLAFASNRSLSSNVRKSATFWVGQSAARAATAGLARIADSDAENTEMQKAAVFALSRRDEPERIDHLLRIARTHANPEVVRSAFFWLADSADQRSLDLFEETLGIQATNTK